MIQNIREIINYYINCILILPIIGLRSLIKIKKNWRSGMRELITQKVDSEILKIITESNPQNNEIDFYQFLENELINRPLKIHLKKN